MTTNELAQLLEGRQMGAEITKDEEAQAKAAGLIAVFGHSDDCVELRGAIHDEAYACEDEEVWIDRKGVKRLNEDEQEVLERLDLLNHFMRGAVAIDVSYDSDNENGFPWNFHVKQSFATFDIMEDGEKFCRGIVFSIDDLPTLNP